MSSPRIAGATVPLFSIRTRRDWGIGQITDFPACAAWIARAGMRLLQVLPSYELAEGETSPYGARTAFGLDPLYIDLDAVEDLDAGAIDDALGDQGRAVRARLRASARVEYGAARTMKGRVLHRAFERFHAHEWTRDTPRAAELRRFVDAERAWAEDLALYVALRDRRGGYGWQSWPGDERDREPAAMARAKEDLALAILEHHYGQWIAHRQWERARTEMRALGVELMGDLPFIVGSESADVWSRAGQFRRDSSLGAPPDAYSADGQDWGLPVYDWAAMDRDDLGWIRARTRRAAELYDRFRLDHVVGYFRQYVRAPGDKHGHFDPDGEDHQRWRGSHLMQTMIYEAGKAQIIGEDLGVVPPFVRATLGELGVPGYRVIPWEQDNGVFRDPTQYPESSVATWSTHDTAPITAWWDEIPEAERDALTRMAELPSGAAGPGTAEIADDARSLALLRVLFRSSSALTLTLAAEILGQRERINTPATVGGSNWTYRLPMPIEDLMEDATVTRRLQAIHDMVRASGR